MRHYPCMRAVGTKISKRTIRELFERPPTQAEAAARIGVDPAVVNRWINGTAVPNGIYLQRLAQYFGVSADEIDLTSEFKGRKNARRSA